MRRARCESRQRTRKAIATTPGVAPYFDLSFQHASNAVLRKMKRFGDPESFLKLLEDVRRYAPEAGIRSNVIVGFPGETEEDLEILCDFLEAARLDVTGVFGYSDEEGTEAAGFTDKLDEDEVAARLAHVSNLVEELTAQRAEERIGEVVDVLVEIIDDEGGEIEIVGRAAHQGPDVDGMTTLVAQDGGAPEGLRRGDLVRATVIASEGVDLIAEV